MIVCDTNIWYDLDREIVENHSLQRKLICTHTTLVELTNTHKNYYNPTKVKKAIRAIGEFGIIRPPNVWEYALSQFTGLRPQAQNAKFLWEGLAKLLTIEYEFDKEQREFAKKYLDEKDKGFNESIEHMNNLAINIKAYNAGKNKELRNYDTPTKRYFIGILLQYYQEQTKNPTSLGISLNHPNWENIELFTNVWNEFYKDLDFHPTQKIHKNDWGDIVNMIFVGKGEQYWTMEKKWLRYMRQGRDTAKYIFDLDLNSIAMQNA